ncbi:NBS-LRR type resistance protein [Cucumis melo var. makuwa]|uniref:NBS-LRR type resistance protein n=1 Tax=Cucumis melo var. makuwa TaxID=1194695 RepID=A0A5A7TGL8_CUCMM|nr:NBS-LRR type resistance protein [Cucumis melo var. makuwa]TYK17924.1 NBS-LRR type resistance protein [Cucumis melo var. makuwa]
MSSLSKEGSRLIVWSCSEKHTFEMGRSCPRLQRMRISIPSLPQRGPKPKACKMTSASSSMTSCPQSIIELQLQAKFDQAMQQIEEQTRNHEALVSEVERMRKLIDDMTREQQGPLYDDP